MAGSPLELVAFATARTMSQGRRRVLRLFTHATKITDLFVMDLALDLNGDVVSDLG